MIARSMVSAWARIAFLSVGAIGAAGCVGAGAFAPQLHEMQVHQVSGKALFKAYEGETVQLELLDIKLDEGNLLSIGVYGVSTEYPILEGDLDYFGKRKPSVLISPGLFSKSVKIPAKVKLPAYQPEYEGYSILLRIRYKHHGEKQTEWWTLFQRPTGADDAEWAAVQKTAVPG